MAKRMPLQAQRSVQSIAIALEEMGRTTPAQPDLFTGSLELVTSPFADYYADLARRVCVRELHQVRA